MMPLAGQAPKTAPSSEHSNVAGSFAEYVNVADVADVGSLGLLSMRRDRRGQVDDLPLELGRAGG